MTSLKWSEEKSAENNQQMSKKPFKLKGKVQI